MIREMINEQEISFICFSNGSLQVIVQKSDVFWKLRTSPESWFVAKCEKYDSDRAGQALPYISKS
jgi:hypothetical protein